MPRRNAMIVAGVALVALLVAIVLLWSKGQAGSTRAFCDSLRKGENPLAVFDRYDPTNVQTAKAVLQQGADRLRELEHAAPNEIRGEVKVLVGVADRLVVRLDPESGAAAVPDLTSEFDKVTAASADVVRFASANCGVSLDSGGPIVTPGAETPST